MSDHSGTRLLYTESNEKGYGVYLFDLDAGGRNLLYEEPYQEAGTGPPNETLFGWSADDKYFSYSQKQQIVICDGHTGETLASIPNDRPVVAGIWLPSNTLVFTDRRVICTVNHAWGKWSQPELFRYFTDGPPDEMPDGPIENLAAFDADSVVWQQGNAIWQCNENSDEPVKVWDSQTNTLLEFSLSQAMGKFLLDLQGASGEFFAEFYPARIWHEDRTANVARINSDEYCPSYLALINNGAGYAFLSKPADAAETIVVKLDDSHAPTEIQCPGEVRGFTVADRAIFAAASPNGEPIKIWRYGLASGFMECMSPVDIGHFDYPTNYPITRNVITNALGEKLTYCLYAPPQSAAEGKHPLIVGIRGEGTKGWNSCDEAFACYGAYFAYTERYHRDGSQWANDALCVYESLAQRSDVDTNQVYLYGVSAGAPAVYDLLTSKSELWRGAILFSPTLLPDPSKLPATKLFVDTGSDDPVWENSSVPMQFEDEATKDGIDVRLLIHPGLTHTFKDPATERERMREALIFLNEPK